MKAGSLDRRIQLQRWTEAGRDAVNTPIMSWETYATVWAQAVPNRSAERFAAREISGGAINVFRIRYRDDVTIKDRILYDDKYFDIQDVRELGRHEGLELDGIARADS